MKFNSMVKNEHGMSLIQVLMATVIVVIIGYFVMQTMVQMKKVEVYTTLSLEAQDFARGVETILYNRQACTHTLELAISENAVSPLPATEIIFPKFLPVKQVVDSKGEVFTQVGHEMSNKQLKLERMDITSKASSMTSNAMERAYLQLTFLKRNEKDSLGGSTMIRQVPILVKVAADNSISGCTAIDEESLQELQRAMCLDMGGTYSPSGCDFSTSTQILALVCNTLRLGMNTNSMSCQ